MNERTSGVGQPASGAGEDSRSPGRLRPAEPDDVVCAYCGRPLTEDTMVEYRGHLYCLGTSCMAEHDAAAMERE